MTILLLPAALLGAAVLYFLFQATALGFRVDRRSNPERYAPGAPDRRLNLMAVAINWKIAKDAETQALRRRMNLFLLAALLGAAVAGLLVSLAVRG